jgi:hypothetical protein
MHCLTDKLSIGQLWVDKNSINIEPDYQRESGVWSLNKKQLFIDSLINNLDIPKIYFHDERDKKQPFSFAVVDGKQRLTAIWEFIEGKYSLADDFKFLDSRDDEKLSELRYGEFSERYKEVFKAKSLDIVYIQQADEEDIEELFSRLNNGEPLNAAEKRNSMGGDMVNLIRNIADLDFFRNLPFKNTRFCYYEISAKFLKLEKNQMEGSGEICDLKRMYLDRMVNENKKMTNKEKSDLLKRVEKNLSYMLKVFGKNNPLLKTQSYPPLMYIFVKNISSHYVVNPKEIREFLENFLLARKENLKQAEENRDQNLIYFGQLMQHGTNNYMSMKERNDILKKYLIKWNIDIEVKDSKRYFSHDERHVIWLSNGKKCSECKKSISFDDMDADHRMRWIDGGKTTLSNAQCLCVYCNRRGISQPNFNLK